MLTFLHGHEPVPGTPDAGSSLLGETMTRPKRNGHLERKLRARVLAKQDTCGICGGYVDKSLPPHLPGSPEVDHIIPIAQGGERYNINNLQLTHRACNRQKSDGRNAAKLARLKATQQEVVTSREW